MAGPDDIKWDDSPEIAWDDANPKGLSLGNKFVNMVGRGAWALPGLVGLDFDRVNAAVTGVPLEQQRAVSQQVDRENPIASGLVRGFAAAPGEALTWAAAPQVKIAQGARALQKSMALGPRIGALSGMSEYGSTGHKPEGERLGGAAATGAVGTLLGGGMAAALPNPAALVPGRPRFDPSDAEMAAARAEGAATGLARADAVAGTSARGGNAAAQNSSTVVVKPGRKIMPDALQPPKTVAEARYLSDRGVTLTGGLRDPNSPYGHIEIASQSRGIVGPGIRNQRQRALGQAMDLAFEEAKPPGVKERIGAGGNANAKYARLKDLWDREFDAVRARDEMIQPAIIRGEEGRPLPAAMEEIVSDVSSPESAVWDTASRTQAKGFLENQMSRLFGRKKDEAGRVPLGDMMTTLSDVRKARRMAQQREKWDLVDIYSRAEDAIEEAVSSQASPATSKRLRELFGGYRNFKIVEDAVLRMKDAPGGISPAKLEQSVASVVGRGSSYASGGGGPIRDLSKAVRTVFDESGSPPTGARILADVGWITDKIAAPTIYLRNRSAAAAQGGAVSSQARAAAKAAAAARLKADASALSPDASLLEQFLSPHPLRSQSPLALALAEAMRPGVRPRLARVGADEEER